MHQEFHLVDRFWQLSKNPTACTLVSVRKIHYIVSYLLIGMRLLHSFYDLIFNPKRENDLDLYFIFAVLFAYLSYIRICPFLSLKCSSSFHIKTTFAVLADVTSAGF